MEVDHQLALAFGDLEIQRQLTPSQGTGGQRPADVEGLGVAEVGEVLRAGGDGVVEVEGVGEVELCVDVDGAVEGDLVEVDVEAQSVGGFTAPLEPSAGSKRRRASAMARSICAL